MKQFKKQRPNWIKPNQYLDPGFQTVFEMSYFRESDSTVPTGWSNVNEDNILPRLSTRMPKPVHSDVEMRSPASWENSDDGSGNEGDASPTDSQEVSSLTRMADESSEEEDIPKLKV